MVCLDKSLTGLNLYLCFDDKLSSLRWSSKAPIDEWSVCLPDGKKDIATLAKLSNLPFDPLPPDHFVKMMKTVGCNLSDNIDWRRVLKPRDFKVHLKRLIEDARDILSKGCTDYYSNVFLPSKHSLEQLEPAKINISQLTRSLSSETSDSQLSALNSFSPVAGGFSRKIYYDQLGSRTGRLTVKSGPQILTLRKDLRKILVSRYQSGKIYQLDFISLEARLALILAGETAERDVYEQISKAVLKNQYSRSLVKIATLSILYGIGRIELAHRLEISPKAAASLSRKISQFFRIKDRISYLEEQSRTCNSITNAYGRVIDSTNAPRHVLCNNFIQSSAVDVALLGFSSIIRSIREKQRRIHPIFIIHDALLLDVHPEESLEDLIELGQIIPGQESLFYLKQSNLF